MEKKFNIGKSITQEDIDYISSLESENKGLNKKLIDLISERIIIPKYQRFYNWDSTIYSRFINAIIDDKKKKIIHLGGVAINNNRLIDGQQRMISFLITLLALYLISFEKNEKAMNAILPCISSDYNDEAHILFENIKYEESKEIHSLNSNIEFILNKYSPEKSKEIEIDEKDFLKVPNLRKAIEILKDTKIKSTILLNTLKRVVVNLANTNGLPDFDYFFRINGISMKLSSFEMFKNKFMQEANRHKQITGDKLDDLVTDMVELEAKTGNVLQVILMDIERERFYESKQFEKISNFLEETNKFKHKAKMNLIIKSFENYKEFMAGNTQYKKIRSLVSSFKFTQILPYIYIEYLAKGKKNTKDDLFNIIYLSLRYLLISLNDEMSPSKLESFLKESLQKENKLNKDIFKDSLKKITDFKPIDENYSINAMKKIMDKKKENRNSFYESLIWFYSIQNNEFDITSNWTIEHINSKSGKSFDKVHQLSNLILVKGKFNSESLCNKSIKEKINLLEKNKDDIVDIYKNYSHLKNIGDMKNMNLEIWNKMIKVMNGKKK